jgi:2-amino-4-hydroxy-6-hydroxymethyldihydropteridine diphosphokinase
MGNRKSYIEKSMQEIEQEVGSIICSSKIYESSPWGETNQNHFLNSVIKVESKLSPYVLLEKLQEIENNSGRIRKEKWGERSIDLDILFYNFEIINTKNLKIPHPYIQERRFVLIPLSEIATDYNHPVLQKNMSVLLKECTDTEKVYEYTI